MAPTAASCFSYNQVLDIEMELFDFIIFHLGVCSSVSDNQDSDEPWDGLMRMCDGGIRESAPLSSKYPSALLRLSFSLYFVVLFVFLLALFGKALVRMGL